MKFAARTDANQVEVVATLRTLGCSVQHLSMVGRGVPDLLIGYDGSNWLIEIKDGNKPPSKRTLTEDEINWHKSWRGQVVVIKSVEEAFNFVNELKSKTGELTC